MKHLLFLLLAVFFFFAPRLFAAVPVGEKLTYNLSFAHFSDAGTLELYAAGTEKLGAREVTAIRARLRTSGIVQATLLDINHDYATYAAPDTHLPVRVERSLRDGLKTNEVRRDFAENETVGAANVHDLLTAIYQIRRLEASDLTAQTFKIWENEIVYDVNLFAVGREKVATITGSFDANVYEIRTADKTFNRYKARIYLSADENRVPLMLKFDAPQGEIRAELVSRQIIAPEPPIVIVEPTPTPSPQPSVRPTPRPTPTPKPYIENQPLDESLPFALGETLVFDVARANQKIGQVQLQIGERKIFFGKDAVIISAKPIGASPVLTANDNLTTYLHPDFIVPYQEETKLGGTLTEYSQLLIFDQERGAVTNEKAVRTEVPVGTHNVLSFIYALRAFRYAEGKDPQDTRAAIFLNGAATIVVLSPKREILTINNKKTPTIALTATTGIPQIDALNLRLWLSDDARRLPLRLTFNSPRGAIQADLKQ